MISVTREYRFGLSMSQSCGRSTINCVATWVRPAPAGIVAGVSIRVTSRPARSITDDRTVTDAALVSLLSTSVLTATVALSAETSGVVTYVPQRATDTASVSSNQTFR